MQAQVASQAASVDWNIVAGAIATFIITVITAWVGKQQGKKKVEAQDNTQVPAIMTGAILQDNYSLIMATEATRTLAEELRLSRYANERLLNELIGLKLEIERLTRKLSP